MKVQTSAILRLLRPRHWVKNLVVLLPVVSSLSLLDPWAWAMAGVAAVAFCLASSGAYVLNDVHDRARDQAHPVKRLRPIASGQVAVPAAMGMAVVLLVASLGVGLLAGPLVALVVAAYVLLQFAYTYFLKSKMLVDVIAIALGFVLRAAAGAVAIGVAISPWLFVCMFTLWLFMGFCKRSNEAGTIADSDRAQEHRPTLAGYTPHVLTHLITLSAAVAVVSFLQYVTAEPTVARFHGYYLVYTMPLVVYGVFRFAVLSMGGRHADPTDILLTDRPLQLTAAMWGVAVVLIALFGQRLNALLVGAG